MAQTSINIRMDEEIKDKFGGICEEMGLTMTTAINVFVRKVINKKTIPFEISVAEESDDPFYSAENMARLDKAIKELEAGKGTFHELIEVDDYE